MKKDQSFGAIPFYLDENKNPVFLLVKHTVGHFDFPKGHKEGEESVDETIKRELLEETGLKNIFLFDDVVSNSYIFRHENETIEKTVVYKFGLLGEKPDVKIDNREISEFFWGSFEEVLEKITFPNMKELFKNSSAIIEKIIDNIKNMNPKDLTKEAPRSPKIEVGGFAILGRTIDKCRSQIAGSIGDYHFNCPLDQYLFSFKGINAEEFKTFVETGASDEDIANWVKENGLPKTEEEIKNWTNAFKTDFSYATDPNKSDWFKGECERLGLDPMKTTLFDYLEIDDKNTFGGK